MIVGLVGAAGSGKSSVANHLVEVHGFVEMSFAAPLKDLAARLFGWDRSRVDELVYKEALSDHKPRSWPVDRVARIPEVAELAERSGLSLTRCAFHAQRVLRDLCGPVRTRREILQALGTEGFRSVYPDFWVWKADQALIDERALDVVFPGVRFENEVDLLARRGAKLWRVRKIGGPGTAAATHSSEGLQDRVEPDVDLVAEHGDLPGLYDQVDLALEVE